MAKCKKCQNIYNLSNKDDVIVGKWCPKINYSPDIECERVCEHFKAMTNADKIRAMSDEELAEFLTGLNEHCLAGIGKIDCSSCNGYCEDNCRRMTRKWLQSEAE